MRGRSGIGDRYLFKIALCTLPESVKQGGHGAYFKILLIGGVFDGVEYRSIVFLNDVYDIEDIRGFIWYFAKLVPE